MADLIKSPCLVLFCKRPLMFQGKQRLAKTIGAEQAVMFARAFLDCALEDAEGWPGPVVLSPASVEDVAWAGRLLRRDHVVLAQPDGGLGERIKAIDDRLRRLGHQQIIFIGSDAPALQPGHFDAARDVLCRSDVALSPALDGGVTLMGAAVPWPDLTFLPWSTDCLGPALAECCRHQGLEVTNIPPSYDIDVEEDLARLWRDLTHDSRPARKALHLALGEFLQQKEVNYG